MYYVYIIKSQKKGKLYKGFSKNIKRRIKEHNSGNVTFTKPDKPWKLIYYEAFDNKIDALLEEKFIKSGKGKERLKYLFNN